MIAMDDYQERRLARHLRDILAWYEDRLTKLEPESELHRLIAGAAEEVRDTLKWLLDKRKDN